MIVLSALLRHLLKLQTTACTVNKSNSSVDGSFEYINGIFAHIDSIISCVDSGIEGGS